MKLNDIIDKYKDLTKRNVSMKNHKIQRKINAEQYPFLVLEAHNLGLHNSTTPYFKSLIIINIHNRSFCLLPCVIDMQTMDGTGPDYTHRRYKQLLEEDLSIKDFLEQHRPVWLNIDLLEHADMFYKDKNAFLGLIEPIVLMLDNKKAKAKLETLEDAVQVVNKLTTVGEK